MRLDTNSMRSNICKKYIASTGDDKFNESQKHAWNKFMSREQLRLQIQDEEQTAAIFLATSLPDVTEPPSKSPPPDSPSSKFTEDGAVMTGNLSGNI